MLYRLGYERQLEAEGTPWKIELPSGECVYTAKLAITAPCETQLDLFNNRIHGYLEISGVLNYNPDQSFISEV